MDSILHNSGANTESCDLGRERLPAETDTAGKRPFVAKTDAFPTAESGTVWDAFPTKTGSDDRDWDID